MNIQNIIGNNLLLFTVNIWIKKLQVVNIQNIFLGIISYDYLSHILERSLDYNWGHFNFRLHGLRAVKVWNTKKKKASKAPWISLDI
jgi:hypothetical protein